MIGGLALAAVWTAAMDGDGLREIPVIVKGDPSLGTEMGATGVGHCLHHWLVTHRCRSMQIRKRGQAAPSRCGYHPSRGVEERC